MRSKVIKIIYLFVICLYILLVNVSPLGVSLKNKIFEQKESSDLIQNTLTKNIDPSEIEKVTIQKAGITDKQYQYDIVSIHQIDEKINGKKYISSDEGKKLSSTTNRNITYEYRTNPLNAKEVIGFLPYWSLTRYQNIDYSKFSTLAYFSLTTDDTGAWIKGYRENGVWYDDGGYVGFHSDNFTNMLNMAHSKGVKVVLLVKNFDPYSIRQIITNRDNAGDRLINNIVNTVRESGLDGVNIDFEYIPKSDKPNDTVTSDLRAKFASWHDKLADRMHMEFPNSHVSTDVFGASAIYYNIYDISALGKTSLDYIVFMTYDYITTRCYAGKYMSPMSPLYGNQGYNTSTHLSSAANKAGGAKIIMGIPYYGIDFQVKFTEKSKYNALVDYPNCDGTIETYGSIVKPEYDVYHNASTINWNDSEKATWYSYSIGGKYRHGYYDDARSLGAKYDFVKSANLGGIAIWAVGYDNNAKELYSVIREKFQKVPFYVNFEYGVSEDKINQIFSAYGLSIINKIDNTTYIVDSGSNISGTVMKNLNNLDEVVKTTFEVESVKRNLR